MSVWAKAIYRDYPFQSVAKHLATESLSIPFVSKLLDFEIDNVPNCKLPFNLKSGNVREQVRFGHVKAEHIIGSGPALEHIDANWEEEFDETIDKFLQQDEDIRNRKAEIEDKVEALKQSNNTPRRVTFCRIQNRRKYVTEDQLLAKLLSRLPEPHFVLQGVYHFTSRYFKRLAILSGRQLE